MNLASEISKEGIKERKINYGNQDVVLMFDGEIIGRFQSISGTAIVGRQGVDADEPSTEDFWE